MNLTCFKLRGTTPCAHCGHPSHQHWWDDTVGVTCDKGGQVCWRRTSEARVPSLDDLKPYPPWFPPAPPSSTPNAPAPSI